MPNEHEPIEARVVDGVAQVDTSTPPPAAPMPPRMLGNLGCLLFPSLLGITSLVLGLWLLSGWDALSPLAALAALMITLFGIALIGVIVVGIFLLLRLRRLMRDLHRDAKNVAQAIHEVATMRAQPNVRADDVPGVPDAPGPSAPTTALPEPPPAEFPDAPEDKPPPA